MLGLKSIAAYHNEVEINTDVTRKMMRKIYINHKATFSHSHGHKLKLIKPKPIIPSGTIFIQSILKSMEGHTTMYHAYFNIVTVGSWAQIIQLGFGL